MQPLSFSKRLTASTAVFSCIFVSSPMQGASQFTTDVPTISAIQLDYAQFIKLYPILIRQDVPNQEGVLDGLISQAIIATQSLSATLSSITATTSDNAVKLQVMRGIVASAVASLLAAQSDEGVVVD